MANASRYAHLDLCRSRIDIAIPSAHIRKLGMCICGIVTVNMRLGQRLSAMFVRIR